MKAGSDGGTRGRSTDAVHRRTTEIFAQRALANWQRTDRLFIGLLLFEWVAAILLALLLPPDTWAGATSKANPHLHAAILFGGLLTGFPVVLALRYPGATSTRYTIAIAQMLWSALFIHLTGGRIETHFHVFGSLAFLAFYRDWRVFVPATAVVLIDHMGRGILWPQSVYGVLTASPWRSLEHAAWVAFIDVFLIHSCRQGVREMWDNAAQHAELEASRTIIADSESRFRSLSAASPVGIYETDRSGVVTYANERWRELVGHKPTIHPDDLDRAGETLRALRKNEDDGEIALRVVHPGDRIAWIHARWRRTRDASGRTKGVVGTVEDVTAQKQLEHDLATARDEALQASRLKSSFVANMSHEIRTPMNAVIGMSGLLEATPLSDEQRDYVATIRTSGDALLSLINDILDFSKIEAGRIDLERLPFDVRVCAEEALDLVAASVGGKPIELALSCDESLPAGVIGDVTRVRQILVNLLSNAIKFTERGEVVLSIAACRTESGGWRLAFAVRDTGIGIPAERMDRLFQLFSQADESTTRRYGGTGLGLAISKRFAELMGGAMWAESAVGVGSVFRFTIEVPEAPAFRHITDDGDDAPLEGRRVLVVDDNATSRGILEAQLSSLGMEPHVAATPQEALDWLQERAAIDFAILDMHMPEMDGLELGRKIREREARRAIILVLLSSIAIAKDAADRRGEELHLFDAMLTKPTKLAQLRATLIQLARGQRHEPSRQRLLTAALDPSQGERFSLRILLAEDNHINQRVSLRVLEQMGYRADVAANGLEVLQALERRAYDVVLMDVQMPEMCGLEATREIHRRTTPDARPWIIAMTANAMAEDRTACLLAGMDDYLAKPVAPRALAEALLRCSERSTRARGERSEASMRETAPEA